MELINNIMQNDILKEFICNECSENGVAVEFSKEIDKNSYIIIHIDKYYNSLNTIVPPSPDCLIIQHCYENKYVIYIVELKNIKNLKGYDVNKLREKFVTCLQDFMSNRFRNFFYNQNYDFTSSLNLIFIAPSGTKDSTKSKATKLDSLLALPLIEFANKKYPIKFKHPNPLVRPCGK